MQREQNAGTELLIRDASPDDYPSFARLFTELLVSDPVPGVDTWNTTIAPSTFIAERGGDVVGYCYFNEYVDQGYVRNVVVDPAERRRGTGRRLMEATREHLRQRGKAAWRLNVRENNHAAVGLYEAMGMKRRHLSTALRFPWASARALPPGGAAVRLVTPERAPALEDQFELPRGMLAGTRRVLLEATSMDGERALGVAVFDPGFPGAFPFRVDDLDALTPLFTAMRTHVPADEYVMLVIEDDVRLVALLEGAGATARDSFALMTGAL